MKVLDDNFRDLVLSKELALCGFTVRVVINDVEMVMTKENARDLPKDLDSLRKILETEEKFVERFLQK